ncbi:hypothetical protein F6X40_11500 [Paraburkholderia sp. UCT31]|uniref:hypothetical protein n=1 Tax=Paraburkholderia sp. UCT31 TaxID=2615209 RepID=UPI001655E974|nr:hypothetical protein [Paraburkholderia sp. UCT31]MBC8737430.1 hypothetical protein [Paraburkholderia sp. UCT31]
MRHAVSQHVVLNRVVQSCVVWVRFVCALMLREFVKVLRLRAAMMRLGLRSVRFPGIRMARLVRTLMLREFVEVLRGRAGVAVFALRVSRFLCVNGRRRGVFIETVALLAFDCVVSPFYQTKAVVALFLVHHEAHGFMRGEAGHAAFCERHAGLYGLFRVLLSLAFIRLSEVVLFRPGQEFLRRHLGRMGLLVFVMFGCHLGSVG